MNTAFKSLQNLVVALAVVTCSGTLAQAQYGYGYDDRFYGNDSASTAGEGYSRGLADVIRSTGDTNLRNSEAAKNYEDARSKNLDNHLKYANTYFDMQRTNREAKAAASTPQLSTDQLYRMAEDSAPKRPSTNRLDPITGQIAWPIVLRDSRYSLETKALNDLFAYRADRHGQIDMDTYTRIANATQSLTAKLVRNVNEYKANDYVAAKNLVQSLSYEARFPIQYSASTN